MHEHVEVITPKGCFSKVEGGPLPVLSVPKVGHVFAFRQTLTFASLAESFRVPECPHLKRREKVFQIQIYLVQVLPYFSSKLEPFVLVLVKSFRRNNVVELELKKPHTLSFELESLHKNNSLILLLSFLELFSSEV